MPKGKSWSDGYHREVLGQLLLGLEGDILDDDSYLKICRETGRLNDLIERLLKLKRVKEAEHAARAAEDYSLFKTLEIFVQQKPTDLAEKLVAERLQSGKNKDVEDRLIGWLSERRKEHGDLAGSLELEENLFWKYPNLEKYRKLHKLAKQLNRWDALRSQIITELENKKNFDFLINLYLYEKKVGNALATLEKLPQRWGDHQQHCFRVGAQSVEQRPLPGTERLLTDMTDIALLLLAVNPNVPFPYRSSCRAGKIRAK